MTENIITISIQSKLREQIEKTEHLIQRLSPGNLLWNPHLPPHSADTAHVLGHLLECLAGFCAVFHAAFPEQLGCLLELRSHPVNHACSREEALHRIHVYAGHIDRSFALCRDADLGRMVPTVFATQETLATLLLGNLEHLINHKYQLFLYLKLQGVAVTTADLYQFRGGWTPDPQ